MLWWQMKCLEVEFRMIVVRTPHRVSFFGGGSDFKEHIQIPGSFSGVFGMAINLYSYVSATFPAVPVKDRFRVSYSKTDNASELSELDHELARETLRYFEVGFPIHIASMSDVPASTGLGTSSAFTVGLVSLLSKKLGLQLSTREIADAAVDIERNRVGHKGGVQDQHWAAYGGVGYFDFKAPSQEIQLSTPTFAGLLGKNSYMCYLGGQRNSSSALTRNESLTDPAAVRLGRDRLATQAAVFNKQVVELASGSIETKFCDCLRESWEIKKSQISVEENVNKVFKKLEQANIPFKLCGAGGTGFLYLFLPTEDLLLSAKKVVRSFGSELFRVLPENRGVEVIYCDT